MRFLTWNINKGGGNRWSSISVEIEKLAPDLIALTEVTVTNLEDIKKSLTRMGYCSIQTTCTGLDNSVLVASRFNLRVADDSIVYDQERWLAVELETLDLRVLCVHIPSDRDHKWAKDGRGVKGTVRKERLWDAVIEYAERHRDERVVILGDFNTGLEIDAEGTPFVMSDRIRILRLAKFFDAWRHLNSRKKEYTWYSPQKNGFRLDHIYVSRRLTESITAAQHVHQVREDKISDHSIVIADLTVAV